MSNQLPPYNITIQRSIEKLYMAIIISQFLYYFSTKLRIFTNFGALFPTEEMNFRSLACIQIFAIAEWVIFNVNTIITLFYAY